MKTKPAKATKNRSQKRASQTRKKLKEAALDAFSEKSVEAGFCGKFSNVSWAVIFGLKVVVKITILKIIRPASCGL